MARGRLTKIPRTGLECRSRYETLMSGGAPQPQTQATQDGVSQASQDGVPQVSPSQQPHTHNHTHQPRSSITAASLCMSPQEGFSDMESGDDELDMDLITVPDTLVVSHALHL